MTQSNLVGKVIRVEWNQEDNSVRLVLEVTDELFKSRVLHCKDYEELLTINGADVMVVASKKKGE